MGKALSSVQFSLISENKHWKYQTVKATFNKLVILGKQRDSNSYGI